VAGYLESEDLEGEQLSTLRSRQQRDVQAAIKTWDLQIFPFLNYPKPTDNCNLYPSGSEEHKQCLCDQQNTCTEVLYWYHPDHLGSSTFLSDAAGVPYQFVLYLPFGELFAEQRAAEWSTPYLFNAKELDTETGLYYYGARYYDPRVSTWWGVDPMAGKYPNESPYLYTANNPIRFIDPTGMEKEDWYLPEGGEELSWANNVTSQASIDKSDGMISGTYIGSSAYRVDENGNTISYNEDGTMTSAIQLSTVEVTPSSGKVDLGETIRQGTINVLGVQRWIDKGIDRPSDALQASGAAMYNSMVFASSFAGGIGSIGSALSAGSWFTKGYYSIDAAVTFSSAFNTFSGREDKMINKLSGFFGGVSLRRALEDNKMPKLHDADAVMKYLYNSRE
jgi:RHS repeat-associated protein